MFKNIQTVSKSLTRTEMKAFPGGLVNYIRWACLRRRVIIIIAVFTIAVQQILHLLWL